MTIECIQSDPYDRNRGPAALRGVAWQRSNECWVRSVLRAYGDRTPYWSNTIRLHNEHGPFCMNCLSDVVELQSCTAEKEVWICSSCDVGSFAILSDTH